MDPWENVSPNEPVSSEQQRIWNWLVFILEGIISGRLFPPNSLDWKRVAPVLGRSYFLLPLLYNLCTKCHEMMLDILPILALLKRGKIWAGQAQKSFWDHVTADFMHYCGIFVCLLFIKSLAMKTCIKSRKAKFNAKSVKAMRLAKSEKARHAAKCVRQPGFLKLAA